mgnify:CR=1 FL=1
MDFRKQSVIFQNAKRVEDRLSPMNIVNRMMENDPFIPWLGIEVQEADAGYSRLSMRVREEMLNGFGIAHGAISFALADSALAFASNGHGNHALSIDCAINHLLPVKQGEELIATARQQTHGKSHGLYLVEVHNASGALVAMFKGMVYLKSASWK